MRKISVSSAATTTSTTSFSTATAAGVGETRVPKYRTQRRSKTKTSTEEAAIYGYIRAVRTLGRTEINTYEIAQALNLPLSTVQAAVRRMQSKGVRKASK